MPHHVQLLLPEALAQIPDHRQGIVDHLLDRHGVGRGVLPVRHTASPLLPPAYGEQLSQPGGKALGKGSLGRPGATVQKQQHRLFGAFALDEHALTHAVDLDEGLLVHAHALLAVVPDPCIVGSIIGERRASARYSGWHLSKNRLRPTRLPTPDTRSTR